MALRQVGRRGYVEMIGEDFRLSRRLYELIDAHPAFEALTQGLSIATFRYVPEELREAREEPAPEPDGSESAEAWAALPPPEPRSARTE